MEHQQFNFSVDLPPNSYVDVTTLCKITKMFLSTCLDLLTIICSEFSRLLISLLIFKLHTCYSVAIVHILHMHEPLDFASRSIFGTEMCTLGLWSTCWSVRRLPRLL